MINPVLPFITDSAENIRSLVRLAHESGAKFIHTYMSMTLRDNQRDYYYSKIDKEIKKRYIETYKESYLCYPLNAKCFIEYLWKNVKNMGFYTKWMILSKLTKRSFRQYTVIAILKRLL